MHWTVTVLAMVLGVLRASSPLAPLSGITVLVPELAKVRTGPGTIYDQVGELSKGQTAPAFGRSQYSDWIQIGYSDAPDGKGWVYVSLVALSGGKVEDLPIVSAPPTATLPPTAEGTVEPPTGTPTIAAPPTFTPPAPATLIVYSSAAALPSGFPPAVAIVALAAIGLIGAVMAVVRRNVR